MPPVLQVKAAAAAAQVWPRAVQTHLREVAVQGVTLHPAAAALAQGQGLLAVLVQPAQVAQ